MTSTPSTQATASSLKIPTSRVPAKKRESPSLAPTPELLQLLGDKTAARKLAQRAGVPVVPGTEEAVTDPEGSAPAKQNSIGFPLIVKAAFGGGGRRHARREQRLRI